MSEPEHSDVTGTAPMEASAPVRKGSTTLMASTRPALRAAAMFGNGTTTYLTEAGLTPFALSSALVSSVWMLLVRLTAIVLPASPAGPLMPDEGNARTLKLFFVQTEPAASTLMLNAPLA